MARVRRYAYTARRKAALRKAQLASAAKRRGKKISPRARKGIRNAAMIGGLAALAGTTAYGGAYGGKVAKNRKARNIDNMVSKDWADGGAKRRAADVAFGKEVATVNNNLRGRGTPDRRRGPLRPYVPSAPYPQSVDRQLFTRSMWVERKSKKGNMYRRPHTDDEMRRRRRNSVRNSPINDLGKRNISPWEATQRTNAYERRMARKGIIINLSHKSLIYDEYKKQKGDEF